MAIPSPVSQLRTGTSSRPNREPAPGDACPVACPPLTGAGAPWRPHGAGPTKETADARRGEREHLDARVRVGRDRPRHRGGLVFAAFIQATARQPESATVTRTYLFLGFALSEALALIGFVVPFILK